MTEAGKGDLTGRVATGAAFLVAARFVMRSLGLINTIVLARLLAPDDFGVVAVAVAAQQLLQGISDFGVQQAVIKFREDGRRTLDVLFTLSAVRGIVIAALLFAAAPIAADVYNDQRMFNVFLGVSLYPLLTGFINPAFHTFERDLDLSADFISNALNKLAGVIVSIAVAIALRSYWAIILGLAASGAVQLALSYFMRPFAPRFTFRGARELFSFSGWLFGVSVVTAFNNKLDMFFVARALGPQQTGLYSIGCQFAELPNSEVASPLARAIYPGLAAIEGDKNRVTGAFLKSVEALALVSLPLSFGFAFVAKDLAPLLLGGQWRGVVPIIEIISPMLGFQSIFLAVYYYGLALGKVKLIFLRELAYFVLRFPIFVWTVFTFGLMGAVYAATGLGFLRVALNLIVYAQASGRPFYEPLLRVRRSIGATMAMSAWFLLLRPFLTFIDGLPVLARLAIDCAMGAAIFSASLIVLWRMSGREAGAERAAIDFVLRRIGRPEPSTGA